MSELVRTSNAPRKCEKCDAEEKIKILCPVQECLNGTACFHDMESLYVHFSSQTDTDHTLMNPFSEMSLGRLNDILSSTIKRDEAAKIITFFGMLVAQTESDQFNIMFNSGSSTGKSYIPGEIAQYFPENDILEFMDASPTSFFHERGVLVVETEERFEKLADLLQPLQAELDALLEKEDPSDEDKLRIEKLKQGISDLKDRAKILVDLEGKVLIFLDNPNTMLLQKLRSFLSHDKKTLEVQITDKSGHGGNRTKHVLLRGYATVIFCTVKAEFDEQEGNRNFILSAGSDLEKIEEALELLDEKLANRELFYRRRDSDPKRTALRYRIDLIRAFGIRKISYDNGSVLENFKSKHSFLNPRALRDYTRIFSLIYGHALLNCFSRDKMDESTIKANEKDVQAAFNLYEPIMYANESGVSPELYSFLTDVILPASERRRAQIEDDKKELPYGLTYQELAKEYREAYHRNITFDKLKASTRALSLAGLLLDEPDPADKRRSTFGPVSNEMPRAQSGFLYNFEDNGGIVAEPPKEDNDEIYGNALCATTSDITERPPPEEVPKPIGYCSPCDTDYGSEELLREHRKIAHNEAAR